MRRAAAVLLVAVACSRPQVNADSTTAGASTAAATPSDTQPAAAPVTSSQPPDSAAIPVATGDVIVGRVDEHGFDPATFLAITPSGGVQTRISGPQLAALGAVKGAEVWARGKREANGFRVDTFEVRRANDRAVEDGIVSVSGTTVTVRTARARLTYADAPTALRNAAGARVWITPPVKGQAPSFGVIRAKQ